MLHLNTIYIRKTEFHRLRELAPGDGKRGPPAQRLTTNAKYEVRPSWATPSSSPHTSLRYFPIMEIDIELYTDQKDPKIEKKLEDLLVDSGIFFDKTETWIDSEKLYEVLYSFEQEA
jgi:hypothetical protein